MTTTKGSDDSEKALVRRDEFGLVPTFDEVKRMMEHMMEEWRPFGMRSVFTRMHRWMPELDVFERDGKLVVRADLPGLKRDEIDIDVENGVLTISGERKVESETKQPSYYRAERYYGRFERSIRLPDDADAQQIEATYEDGVLEVTLPKPAKITSRVKVPVK